MICDYGKGQYIAFNFNSILEGTLSVGNSPFEFETYDDAELFIQNRLPILPERKEYVIFKKIN
jgi:hypothetical protein